MVEKICTIPLREAFEAVRPKRTRRAIRVIREYASRHMKADIESVRISAGVNSALLEHGKPPRRIKAKLVTDDKGLTTVWLMDEQEKIASSKKKLEETKKAKDERNKKSQEAAKAKKATPVKPATDEKAKVAQTTPAKPASTATTVAKPATPATPAQAKPSPQAAAPAKPAQ